MKKNIRKEEQKRCLARGFTLLELILYVALFAVFLSGVVGFGIGVIQMNAKSRIEQEVIYNMRLASKRIVYEIRNASGINSLTSTSLSLSNTDPLRDPTVISFSGGRIRIGYGSGGNCPTASPCYLTSSFVNISDFSFTNMSDGANKSAGVAYKFTVNSISNGKQSYEYSQNSSGSGEIRSKQ